MSSSLILLETTRWRAIQNRDKSFHSTFIYAVLTTRIFCRPTCPARLARRANVVFFDSATEATKAGFRPCKRCKPTRQDLDFDIHGVARTVNRACEFIKARGGHVLIGEVADHVGISVRHMYGVFKRVVGCSPAAYASHMRMEHPQTKSENPLSVTERGDDLEMQIDHHVDYGSPSTYTAMDSWAWESDHDLLALSESCALMSPRLVTPIFADSPGSADWTLFTQPEACRTDTTMVTVHLH